MNALQTFDLQVAAIHGLDGGGDDVMDVRHEEFMAMANAFLGSNFDREKLTGVETLQIALYKAQSGLDEDLASNRIDRKRYLDEVSQLHLVIARECEQILGAVNFFKLFGIAPEEVIGLINREQFLAPAV